VTHKQAPRGVSRRATLLAPLLLAAAPVNPTAGAGWIATLAARCGHGLLRSYDVSDESAFDLAHAHCAYSYDNAAVGIALLAAGRLGEARGLGEALLAAQARDRFWRDGRMRNAYAAGLVAATGAYPLPGWWDKAAGKWVEDAYQVGTATGVVAWVMLFWLALGHATGEARFAEAAAKAGDWVERFTRGTQGYAGGFIGWEPGPAKLGWVSTEHNLDLAVAFAGLGREDAAAHARRFVAAKWDGATGHFATGLRPDGTKNPHPAVDANLWPLLAPDPDPAWRAALDWVLAHQGVPAAAPQGVDFDDDRDGIWLEGTAYAALVAARQARAPLAASLMATLRAETAPGGLVWATSVPRLTTGLSTGVTDNADFFYFRRPHIAATAWAALAEIGKSPF
jgi:hypothetical protein